MVAAKWAQLKRGGEAGVHKTNPPIGGLVSATKTRDEAATLLNVGTSSIDRAKQIITNGAAGLAEQVERGQVTVDSARLRGDGEQLAILEKRKRVLEEVAKLEGAGFSRGEAMGPATAKIEAEDNAKARETAAAKAEEERQKIADILNGKLDDVRGRQAGQQYESSVGAGRVFRAVVARARARGSIRKVGSPIGGPTGGSSCACAWIDGRRSPISAALGEW